MFVGNSSGGSSGGSSSGGSNNGSWIPNAVVSAGSGIAGLFGRKKAYKRSKQLMSHQLDLSKQMWEYQNAYNTPEKQMQRLKDAGLNPALMYGQGTTGNAQGAPQAQYNDLAPYSSPAEHAQSVAAGVQMSLANAQKRNIESQTTLNSITGAVKSGEFGIAKEMSKYQMGQLEADTTKKYQEIENLKSQKGLTDQKILSEKTINSLNKEYLKMEKAGYHKGNYIGTIFKSIFGLDLKNKNDQMIARSIIGTYLGSSVINNVTGGLAKAFKTFFKK